MYENLIQHVETQAGLSPMDARAALSLILNAADRQGSPFARAVFTRVPGARGASAIAGSDIGAATGEIARLIEQTPGGRRHVFAEMFRELQARGLGHADISRILPAVSDFLGDRYGLSGFGHLGDLIGTDLDAADAPVSQTVAA